MEIQKIFTRHTLTIGIVFLNNLLMKLFPLNVQIYKHICFFNSFVSQFTCIVILADETIFLITLT